MCDWVELEWDREVCVGREGMYGEVGELEVGGRMSGKESNV